MFLAWFSELVVVVIIGLVVKLVDDYLDEETSPLLVHLSRGVLPYALLLLLFALAIDFRLGAALFLAAYAVGMVGTGLNLYLPTHLSPLTESILALLAGAYISGWQLIGTACAAMVAVQALDDLIDYSQDWRSGTASWCTRLGPIPTGLILAIGVGLGLLWAPVLCLEAIIISRLISALSDSEIKVVRGE